MEILMMEVISCGVEGGVVICLALVLFLTRFSFSSGGHVFLFG